MDLEPEQRQALSSAHSIRSAIPIGMGLSGDSSTPRAPGDLAVTDRRTAEVGIAMASPRSSAGERFARGMTP